MWIKCGQNTENADKNADINAENADKMRIEYRKCVPVAMRIYPFVIILWQSSQETIQKRSRKRPRNTRIICREEVIWMATSASTCVIFFIHFCDLQQKQGPNSTFSIKSHRRERERERDRERVLCYKNHSRSACQGGRRCLCTAKRSCWIFRLQK